MFWLDEGLASNIYIDGVVTVVDAEHITKCLDDVGGHWHKESLGEDVEFEDGITTAHLQLALADVILLNKIDKVSGTEPITQRIRQINQTSLYIQLVLEILKFLRFWIFMHLTLTQN